MQHIYSPDDLIRLLVDRIFGDPEPASSAFIFLICSFLLQLPFAIGLQPVYCRVGMNVLCIYCRQ